MNSAFKITSLLIVSLFFLVAIGCNQDEDLTFNPSIDSPDGVQKSMVDYFPEDYVDLIINGQLGSFPLTTFWILKGGSLASSTDYWLNGSFPNNSTILLQGSERFSFSYSIRLFLPDSENSTTVYRFYIEDEEGNQDFIEYSFKIGLATPVALNSGKLYSSNGTGHVGGINLSTGASVHYSDSTATILNLGNINDQWKIILPANGSEIKSAQVNFAKVKYKEEVQSAFIQGNPQSLIEASEDLIFVVAKGGVHYLVEVQKLVEGEVEGQEYIQLVIKH